MAPKSCKTGNCYEPNEMPTTNYKKGQKNKAFEVKSKRSMSVGELDKRSKQRHLSYADNGSNNRMLGSATVLDNRKDDKRTTYSRILHFCRKLKGSFSKFYSQFLWCFTKI